MVQHTTARLDASFAPLSDATRRGVLERLGRADASITELAEKFHMTLTGMKKHVVILERARSVTTEKAGRVRTCKLGLRGLEEEAAWIEGYRQRWDARFDALDKIVEEMKRKEKVDGQRRDGLSGSVGRFSLLANNRAVPAVSKEDCHSAISRELLQESRRFG